MSKRQWGHGYWRGKAEGYNQALYEQGRIETFKEHPNAHWVPVGEYGSRGIEPLVACLCEHNLEYSCISGSGDSVCTNYWGRHLDHIICIGKIPAKEPLFLQKINERQSVKKLKAL